MGLNTKLMLIAKYSADLHMMMVIMMRRRKRRNGNMTLNKFFIEVPIVLGYVNTGNTLK
jgi:hypothetical protein